jgi:hypothetical protein
MYVAREKKDKIRSRKILFVQILQMRLSQGRGGDGNATLRTWTNRRYIVYDDTVGRYCKTTDYKTKYSSKP